MSWQRDDEGSLVYESTSLWRAVVFHSAGVYGAFIERPPERSISAPFSFESVQAAQQWAQQMLARQEPTSHPASQKRDALARCTRCGKPVPATEMSSHLIQCRYAQKTALSSSPRTAAPTTRARVLPSNAPPQTGPTKSRQSYGSHPPQSPRRPAPGPASQPTVRNASPPPSGKKACPVCGKVVSAQGVTAHIQAKHGRQHIRAERHSRSEPSVRGNPYNTEISLEALEQSFEDRRDAGRGWGHHRRDYDGTFGSFPVHDDYGDESDAW